MKSERNVSKTELNSEAIRLPFHLCVIKINNFYSVLCARVRHIL